MHLSAGRGIDWLPGDIINSSDKQYQRGKKNKKKKQVTLAKNKVLKSTKSRFTDERQHRVTNSVTTFPKCLQPNCNM